MAAAAVKDGRKASDNPGASDKPAFFWLRKVRDLLILFKSSPGAYGYFLLLNRFPASFSLLRQIAAGVLSAFLLLNCFPFSFSPRADSRGRRCRRHHKDERGAAGSGEAGGGANFHSFCKQE